MGDGSDPAHDADDADDADDAWERDFGADDVHDARDEATSPVSAEVIYDPTSSTDSTTDAAGPDDDAFAALLRMLRALPGPCAPPIGEGAFDILYASAREIVVWFMSAKDGVGQKEVAIPAGLARRAWEIMRRGEPMDEAALRAIASGASGGRWLLALFAQLPTVEVRSASASDDASDASDDASQAVTLIWRGDLPERS